MLHAMLVHRPAPFATTAHLAQLCCSVPISPSSESPSPDPEESPSLSPSPSPSPEESPSPSPSPEESPSPVPSPPPPPPPPPPPTQTASPSPPPPSNRSPPSPPPYVPPPVPANAELSPLWGREGELFNARSALTDFSQAGYAGVWTGRGWGACRGSSSEAKQTDSEWCAGPPRLSSLSRPCAKQDNKTAVLCCVVQPTRSLSLTTPSSTTSRTLAPREMATPVSC